jgi:hypothetical protein
MQSFDLWKCKKNGIDSGIVVCGFAAKHRESPEEEVV